MDCKIYHNEESKCTFDCDESKSYYHSIEDDLTSPCVQRCECNRDSNTGARPSDKCLDNDDRVQACIDVAKSSLCDNLRTVSENDADDNTTFTYCVQNADDFLGLDDWIKLNSDNKERLTVSMVCILVVDLPANVKAM